MENLFKGRVNGGGALIVMKVFRGTPISSGAGPIHFCILWKSSGLNAVNI